MFQHLQHANKSLGAIIATWLFFLWALPAHADGPGRGLTAQFEKDYLVFIINHHFSALRITELAAGTDRQRDAAVANPQEGTSPTPDTSPTPAKASDDEIRSMARAANRMQREEIAKAQRFLKEWYGMDSTPQLSQIGQQQIALLEQTAAGEEFNREFLEIFSTHHYHALIPSLDCQVKSELKHDMLRQYCQGIVENQTREIHDLRTQLCNKFGICDYQPTNGVNGRHSASSR